MAARPAFRCAFWHQSFAPTAASAAQTSKAIYAEGLRLHRAGQYDDAIARFAAVQSPP